MSKTAQYLDPATLAKIISLPLKARAIVEGALSGLHRARHHGSSVEFAQHKEYSPGDSVRHIDWKAYAKLDRYYIKQFEHESQLTAHLVLDTSGSMGYAGETKGALTKIEYASYLLASLAYLLIRQRDRVGLSFFGNSELDGYVPPRARTTHLHDLLTVIEDINRRGAAGTEPARAALERIAELSRRRRSLIVLCSDLFEEDDGALQVLRRLRVQGHDTVLFHILAPDELDFPFDGLTLFESLEDDQRMLANPRAIRAQYLERMRQFLDNTRSQCLSGGVEYHQLSTGAPLDQALLDFLTPRTAVGKSSGSWNS